MRKQQKGFSLIELLIVVAIILIIAAIAIPNLMRARMAANDSSAAASERTIITGEIGYSAAYPTIGFGTLPVLGGAVPCTPGVLTGCLIDNNLALNGTPAGAGKSGYTFTYTAGEKSNGAIRSYNITAVPVQVGKTGWRRFYSDESGEIHSNALGSANASSPTIQ